MREPVQASRQARGRLGLSLRPETVVGGVELLEHAVLRAQRLAQEGNALQIVLVARVAPGWQAAEVRAAQPEPAQRAPCARDECTDDPESVQAESPRRREAELSSTELELFHSAAPVEQRPQQLLELRLLQRGVLEGHAAQVWQLPLADDGRYRGEPRTPNIGSDLREVEAAHNAVARGAACDTAALERIVAAAAAAAAVTTTAFEGGAIGPASRLEGMQGREGILRIRSENTRCVGHRRCEGHLRIRSGSARCVEHRRCGGRRGGGADEWKEGAERARRGRVRAR